MKIIFLRNITAVVILAITIFLVSCSLLQPTLREHEVEWCTVPAGEYVVGESAFVSSNGKLVRDSVGYLYQIMKYEVTNNQYCLFLEELLKQNDTTLIADKNSIILDDHELIDLDNPECKIRFDGKIFIVQGTYAEHPAVAITWFGADAYAKYYGYRLPTFIEWQKALNGESDISQYIERFDSLDVSRRGTYPVESSSNPSYFGVEGMIGNAAEWLSDDLRGGYIAKWESILERNDNQVIIYNASKTSFKNFSYFDISVPFNPNYGYGDIGFRCVRDITSKVNKPVK